MARLEEPDPPLHPSLANLHRQKVEQLATAPDTGDEIGRAVQNAPSAASSTTS
jgi:hypothetical protein